MEIMNFKESKKILAKYKMPLCQTEIFDSKDKGMVFAKKIGYPVVLKVYGPQIFHKSEIGGVETGIGNDEEFSAAWERIISKTKDKEVEGILVQETIPGTELAVGMKRDDQFGPVLMFGLGGIFIEIIKDVSLRIAPINKEEALKMIKEIKGYKLLEGYRGKDAVDTGKIANLLFGLSSLSVKEDKIASVDFNPVIVNKQGTYIVDVRIII